MIARSMTASALVPQFTIEWDASLAVLAALRDRLAAAGRRLGYTDALVAGCAAALREHPGLNASWDEDAILEHADINVGLAIAVSDGLIAPAIWHADGLSLAQIATERDRLTAAATAGSLTPEDVFSTTFTISNLGPFGVRRFRALVVPPQAAILALGAMTDDRRVSLSLSCDHRVLDGAPAAAFLGDLVGRLEAPEWLEARLGEGAT